jgi:hypothetical protein
LHGASPVYSRLAPEVPMLAQLSLVAFWLVLSLGPKPATGQSPQATSDSGVPLSVTSYLVDVGNQTISLTLHNTSNRAITAWHVDIRVGTPPAVRSGGVGVDAFRQYEGVPTATGGGYLVAGGTATTTLRLPVETTSVDSIELRPSVAIYADKSYSGDPRLANMVFQRRADELKAWREITPLLDSARNAGTVDASVLESLLSQIVNSSTDPGDFARKSVGSNLRGAILSVRAGRVQPTIALNRIVDEAHRNLAAVAAHSK